MATQAEIDAHAFALARVRTARDELLESFGETVATVTDFNLGENSQGFEIDPDGGKVIIKGDVALAQLGFYLMPTVSVFEFEGGTLRIPNADLFMIRYHFYVEGEPGVSDPSFFSTNNLPNRDERVEIGVSPSGFFAAYTYEYEGVVMGDDLIPAFEEEFLANWRSASEVYAVLDVREIGSGLPEPNVGNDFIVYAGPRPDVAADAIASQAFFGDNVPDAETPDPEAPDGGGPDADGPTENADSITGAAGNDTISGLGGDDSIKGGGGDDLLLGGAGDDRISGNGGADRIRGNGGADTLKGGGGGDNIKGNGGDDVIKAGGGADTVKGGGGSDVINGGGGADVLNGGGGADVITGRGGDDTLKGNGGADVFQFRASDRNDTIVDFRQGQDLIEIISGARSFAGLTIEQDGADVLIGFGAGGVRVITDNAGAFSEDDFIF